ncbi:MAG: CRISPR-associated endonuclease Cas2 [Trichlorobacter sp.]|jgi:CRISPR-associated protein Cas2|nr:CRISPR-associated endonuclease Cas2 [Trichlorobacter sp.]
MYALVSYDISSHKTRARFHKFLKEFGLNTQKSVFECDIDQQGIERIMAQARTSLNPQTDALFIYRICSGCQRKVQISGMGLKVVQLDFMIL